MMRRRSFLQLAASLVALPALRWTAAPRVEEELVETTLVHWTGAAGDGRWSTAGNWTPRPPADGDDVVIGDGAVVDGGEETGVELGSLTIAGGATRIGSVDVGRLEVYRGDLTLEGGTVSEAVVYGGTIGVVEDEYDDDDHPLKVYGITNPERLEVPE